MLTVGGQIAQTVGGPGWTAQVTSLALAVSSLMVAFFGVMQARAANRTTDRLAARSIAREEFDDVLAANTELRAQHADDEAEIARLRQALTACREERDELQRTLWRARNGPETRP